MNRSDKIIMFSSRDRDEIADQLLHFDIRSNTLK